MHGNRGQASGSQPACRVWGRARTCYQLRFSQACVGSLNTHRAQKALREASMWQWGWRVEKREEGNCFSPYNPHFYSVQNY